MNTTVENSTDAKQASPKDVPKHECCPPFDPSNYCDNNGNCHKLITWKNKPFVKDGTRCLLHMPLGFERAVKRAFKKINDANAGLPNNDVMILSDCSSPWFSNIFVSVAKEEVAGAEVETITGTFLAKAFEGAYSNIRYWIKEMHELVPQVTKTLNMEDNATMMEKLEVDKLKFYLYYPTCPKCAEKYGKNYVVIFAKLSRE